MSRWIAGLLTLGACTGGEWRDVSDGAKVSDGKWYSSGAVAFVSARGLERYSEHGAELLSARFGAGIHVDLPLTETIAADQPVSFGEQSMVLRPSTLAVETVEGSDLLRLDVGFQPLVQAIDVAVGSASTCRVTVGLDPVTVSVSLAATRDVAGHLSLVAVDIAGVLGQPDAIAGAGCVVSQPDAIGELEALVGVSVYQAVESALVDPGGMVDELATIGESVAGSAAPGRLDVARLSVVVTAHATDGSEPVMTVSTGALVTPLQVGVDSTPDPCAAGLGDVPTEKPPPIGAPSPELLEAQEADVALALRRDLLQALLSHAARSGLLCGRSGFGQPGLALEQVATALPDGDALMKLLGPDAPVSIRLRLSSDPSLKMAGSKTPSIDVLLEGLITELYVEAWSTDWLVYRSVSDAALSGWTPTLDGDVVRLVGGSFSVLDGDAAGDIERLAVDGVTGALAVFALPPIYPYALSEARFELVEDHLVMFADLAMDAAPRLEEAAVSLPEAPRPAAGCSTGWGSLGRRTPWLSILLVFALVGGIAVQAAAQKRVLVYSGKLLDERAAPIGGVFPLTFALYSKSRGGKALWKENHFVAVDSGLYAVELGRKKPISKSISLDSLWVGVKITGGPELVRERFVAEGAEPELIIRNQGGKSKQGGRKQPGGVVDYAEKAGFAYVAEKADNAVRIDGLSIDQLRKQLGGEGGGKGGGRMQVKLGSNTFNAPSAGGDGGTPYQQLCPDGYVVTGLRGGSGLYVDRVGLICSPLETGNKKTK